MSDAAALGVEPPAVVRALQPALDDRAGGQRHQAVRAPGREGADLAAGPQPDDDERPAAGAHRQRRRPHLGGAGHRVPAGRVRSDAMSHCTRGRFSGRYGAGTS